MYIVSSHDTMYGQFPFPFVICPMEFRNLLNSTLQISTTHPVSSNLTPSPLGSAWVPSLTKEGNAACARQVCRKVTTRETRDQRRISTWYQNLRVLSAH